jgi:hypothetical protein
VGAVPDSPVTLLFKGTSDTQTERIDNLIITLSKSEQGILVLDSEMRSVSAWVQPVHQFHLIRGGAPVPPGDLRTDPANPYNFSVGGIEPSPLPASWDGRVVMMPNLFLVLGTRFSTACPYGGGFQDLFGGSRRRQPPRGSLSGFAASSAEGDLFIGGSRVGREHMGACVTPCGRYRWTIERESAMGEVGLLDLSMADSDKMLLRVSGTSVPLGSSPYRPEPKPQQTFYPLGSQGLLGLLNFSGQVLQLLDINIPELAKKMFPTQAHITSQPQFYVSEGFSMDYQVEVNNPKVVTGYRLRTPVPGAAISDQGLFHFAPPMEMKAPQHVDMAVEVTTKSGEVLSQQFPIYILAIPKS